MTTAPTGVKMKTEELFVLDAARLSRIARELSASYASAEPFPHAVIDGLVPDAALRRVAEHFPAPGRISWHEFDNWRQRKLAVEREEEIEGHARWLLYQLNSSVFVNFLEELTGIEGLIPDPHFTGGGLHQIERGGYLKIHADFNRHPRLRLDRRLNLLLYLNEDWKEEYGGHLELWDGKMERCVSRILPAFNRCVVFSTTDFSNHGHPEPLACPEGRTRKSLALYYYSNGRPAGEADGDHGTLMRLRPGEAPGREGADAPLRGLLRRCVPPVALDLYRRVRGGRRR